MKWRCLGWHEDLLKIGPFSHLSIFGDHQNQVCLCVSVYAIYILYFTGNMVGAWVMLEPDLNNRLKHAFPPK